MQFKSRFANFDTSVLLGARDTLADEIKVRLARYEAEFKFRMGRTDDPNGRAKLTHLIQIRRAQAAVQIVSLKVLDEIISKREQNKNAEVQWVDDQDIVFVEEPR